MAQHSANKTVQSKKVISFLIILASIIGAIDIFFIIIEGLEFLIFLGGGGSFLNLIFAMFLLTPLTKNIPKRTGLIIASLIPNTINLAGVFLIEIIGFRYFHEIQGALLILFIISFYIIIKNIIHAFGNKLSWKFKLFLFILLISTSWALLLGLAILTPCFMGSCI